MESLSVRHITIESTNFTEWPKVPTSSPKLMQDEACELDGTQIYQGERDNIDNKSQYVQDLQVEEDRQHLDLAKQHVENLKRLDYAPVQLKGVMSPEPRFPEQRWTFKRLIFKKSSSWPNPELSIGSKCSRILDRECWEAIGPAQELFIQISDSIRDLLDSRVDDIEEGEPVAGHILTYGMYMIGREAITARPTLIFTCERPRPRQRAMKFVKESEILKGHPKVLLAQSSILPMALGRHRLRLLAGPSLFDSSPSSTAWIAKRDNTTTTTAIIPAPSYHSLSAGAKAGVGVGIALFGLFVVALLIAFPIFYRRQHRHRAIKELLATIPAANHHLYSRNPDVEAIGPIYKPEMAKLDSVPPTYTLGCLEPVGSSTSNPAVVPLHQTSKSLGDCVSPETVTYTSEHPDPSSSKHNPLPGQGPARPPPESPEIKDAGPLQDFVNPYTNTARSPLLMSREEFPPVPLLDCTGLYGMSVLSKISGRNTTIGGVLVFSDRFYGLTVNHSIIQPNIGLEDIQESIEGSSTAHDNYGHFSFDSGEEETTSEVDVADVAITSKASISTGESVSRISSIASGLSERVQGSIPSTIGLALPDRRISSTKPITNIKPVTVITENMIPSVINTQKGLDWALIELSVESVLQAKKAFDVDKLSRTFITPSRCATKPNTETEVVAIKGGSGRSRGTVSPSPSMMKLGPSGKFQEVWTVRFDSPLVEGDSGSWVCDKTTGDIYGHIVAGVPEIGLAYIIPANKVFQEIGELLGPIDFASNAFTELDGKRHSAPA